MGSSFFLSAFPAPWRLGRAASLRLMGWFFVCIVTVQLGGGTDGGGGANGAGTLANRRQEMACRRHAGRPDASLGGRAVVGGPVAGTAQPYPGR